MLRSKSALKNSLYQELEDLFVLDSSKKIFFNGPDSLNPSTIADRLSSEANRKFSEKDPTFPDPQLSALIIPSDEAEEKSSGIFSRFAKNYIKYYIKTNKLKTKEEVRAFFRELYGLPNYPNQNNGGIFGCLDTFCKTTSVENSYLYTQKIENLKRTIQDLNEQLTKLDSQRNDKDYKTKITKTLFSIEEIVTILEIQKKLSEEERRKNYSKNHLERMAREFIPKFKGFLSQGPVNPELELKSLFNEYIQYKLKKPDVDPIAEIKNMEKRLAKVYDYESAQKLLQKMQSKPKQRPEDAMKIKLKKAVTEYLDYKGILYTDNKSGPSRFHDQLNSNAYGAASSTLADMIACSDGSGSKSGLIHRFVKRYLELAIEDGIIKEEGEIGLLVNRIYGTGNSEFGILKYIENYLKKPETERNDAELNKFLLNLEKDLNKALENNFSLEKMREVLNKHGIKYPSKQVMLTSSSVSSSGSASSSSMTSDELVFESNPLLSIEIDEEKENKQTFSPSSTSSRENPLIFNPFSPISPVSSTSSTSEALRSPSLTSPTSPPSHFLFGDDEKKGKGHHRRTTTQAIQSFFSADKRVRILVKQRILDHSYISYLAQESQNNSELAAIHKMMTKGGHEENIRKFIKHYVLSFGKQNKNFDESKKVDEVLRQFVEYFQNAEKSGKLNEAVKEVQALISKHNKKDLNTMEAVLSTLKTSSIFNKP